MIMNLRSVALFMWIIELTTSQSSANACKDGDVRLRGGSHYREGRVEVCRNQQWGGVCDDMWDEKDSAVVCKQLGFSEKGAEPVTMYVMGTAAASDRFGASTLPFLLDDVGCNGSEINLLDCLPQHNCGGNKNENAGVQCLHNGVKLEHNANEESNNTLITIKSIGAALFCSTDREDCCTDEFNISGNWFLPNGSKLTSNLQSLYITLGNQTVGLNIMNSPEFPTGIYHCEMMDRKNVTHYLYAGVYPENEGNVTYLSIKYNRANQTITCTSTGGPATDVTWSKDNERISMASNEGLYEHLQIIKNTVNATYENNLRIVDKSSKVAGIYTCKISNSRGNRNESLYIKVCKDMELRVNNKSRLIEVCIDDQWHETTSNTIEANNSQSPPDISVQVVSTSSAIISIIWSVQSIPNDKIISGYDISCTRSALSDGQIHEVKVPNISISTIKFQVNGLLSGTVYECCVSAHVQTNTPLDLISSSCATITTKSDEVPGSDVLAVGLGTGVGLLLVIVCVGSIFVNILLVMRLRNSATTNFKTTCTNEGHEEDDSDHDQRLVGNPIYGGSQPTAGENRTSERENYDVLHHNVGKGTTGMNPIGAYEMISNLPTQPNRNIQTLQTDGSAAYAKLGADGIGANAEENVTVGVKENEVGSPYANIFGICPSDQ